MRVNGESYLLLQLIADVGQDVSQHITVYQSLPDGEKNMNLFKRKERTCLEIQLQCNMHLHIIFARST